MKRSDHFNLLMFTFMIALLLLPMLVRATTITLTQEQVDAVRVDNPCEVCPEPPVEPPIEPPIEPPVEPPTTCEDSNWQSSVFGWGSVFYTAFPGPVYENVMNKIVPRYGYYAIGFNTRGFVDDGKLSLLENSSTPGLRMGSISECKGDFNVSSSCRTPLGLGGGVRWSTNNKMGSCKLKSNTTYYFNVTFTNGVDNTQSNCGGSPCYINLQHTNF